MAAAAAGATPVFNLRVFHHEEPLAFSAAEGEILITDALVLKLQTEDELSAVIAHELAHTILHHISYTSSESGAPELILSKQNELDADRMSIQLLVHAGYDPLATMSALRALYRQRAGTDGGNDPLEQLREEALATELARHSTRTALRPRLRSELFGRVKSEIVERTTQMR